MIGHKTVVNTGQLQGQGCVLIHVLTNHQRLAIINFKGISLSLNVRYENRGKVSRRVLLFYMLVYNTSCRLQMKKKIKNA